MKNRIFKILDTPDENDYLSKIYDIFMIILVFVSVIPLIFIESKNEVIVKIEYLTVVFFITDYLLRWWTYDLVSNKNKMIFNLKYPFTFFAIIDLISILPIFLPLNKGFKALRLFRIFKAMRIFKVLRYSKNLNLIKQVFQKEKDLLIVFMGMSTVFIFISALLVFQVEHEAQPENFKNFFDSIWWAVATLTTVGYGDLYPITTMGRIISMIISLSGIALIAVPSGIIAAGFIDEIKIK